MVSIQMDSMSRIVSRLASEIKSDIIFRQDMAEKLSDALKRQGIRSRGCGRFENIPGLLEITIKHAGCDDTMPCKTIIEKTAKRITGVKMTREQGECGRNVSAGVRAETCTEKKFGITTGIAIVPKHGNNVSGTAIQ